MQEIIEHARRIFVINYGSSDKFLVFNQEICYSYACKMLFSIGPKLIHFSNSPTTEELIKGELFLALNSPYTFNEEKDRLLCYETLPSLKGEEKPKKRRNVVLDLLCHESMP